MVNLKVTVSPGFTFAGSISTFTSASLANPLGSFGFATSGPSNWAGTAVARKRTASAGRVRRRIGSHRKWRKAHGRNPRASRFVWGRRAGLPRSLRDTRPAGRAYRGRESGGREERARAGARARAGERQEA